MGFIAWALSKLFGGRSYMNPPTTKRDSTKEVEKFERERKP